jgi:hypothetical protein
MGEKKQARLVERGHKVTNGGSYEIWDVGNDSGICIDFNPSLADTIPPETMAFPVDLRNWEVTSWDELGVWYVDATGGKAIRELGYDPVEEDGDA